jgi:hypothetical protein
MAMPTVAQQATDVGGNHGGHYKAIIGSVLRASDWRAQRTEADVAVAVLNRMPSSRRPSSVRTSVVAASATVGLGQPKPRRDQFNNAYSQASFLGRAPCEDAVRHLLGDHDRGQVRICARDTGHDRGIDHA